MDFQREVEAEIRRRLVADRGAADVARTLRKPLPEDADFLTASTVQITQLREIVQPMARKLAARLAGQQRHRRRGALDFRRTVRESMSAGGVPMTPVFKPPKPAKPELVILADISGSVSAFAEFTLHLTYALRTEFTRVRSFVFVDTVDEVTEILAQADDIAAATAQINARGCGVWLDGRSDYGNALRAFRDRYGQQLRSRATVLVLGDARANYHASGAFPRLAGSVVDDVLPGNASLLGLLIFELGNNFRDPALLVEDVADGLEVVGLVGPTEDRVRIARMESPLHAVRGVNNFLLVEDEKWRAVGLSKVLDTDATDLFTERDSLVAVISDDDRFRIAEVATDIRRRVHFLPLLCWSLLLSERYRRPDRSSVA